VLLWLVGYGAGVYVRRQHGEEAVPVEASLCRRQRGTSNTTQSPRSATPSSCSSSPRPGSGSEQRGIKARRHGADPDDVRKSAVIAVGLVTLVVYLLVTTHGKSCHYNVHFSKRLVCTDDPR
jgi:hypothetical protein